jgi:hypothetical protein
MVAGFGKASKLRAISWGKSAAGNFATGRPAYLLRNGSMLKHSAFALLVLGVVCVSDAQARLSPAQINTYATDTINRIATGAATRNDNISTSAIDQINSLVAAGRTTHARRLGNLAIRAIQGNTAGAIAAIRAISQTGQKLITRGGGDPAALLALANTQIAGLQGSRDQAIANIQAVLP